MTILLIDGRSGSGKTELARAIIGLRPDAQLVRLDDLYPGWRGLEAGSRYVHEVLLATGRWQRWDWTLASREEWHELDPDRSLVVEGCGAVSRVSRAHADYAVWVSYPIEGRRRRALAREPDFEPHWLEWAEQEDAFIARERPELLADEVLDGENVTAQAERLAKLL
jgi:hypothetical protein